MVKKQISKRDFESLSEDDKVKVSKLLSQLGSQIRFYKNVPEKIQINAVNNDPYAIEYIDNPSEEVQFAAVNQNGYAIQYIQNPSERVQLVAVKETVGAIGYINNPSKRVQMAALNTSGATIRFIKNATPQLINRFKKEIIIYLLSNIKSGNDLLNIQYTLNFLDNHGIEWPELDIIKQSINSDNQIK